MVRKVREAVIERLKDGNGKVLAKVLAEAEGLNGKGRLFNHFVLEPGASIGYHMHEGETEWVYF